MPNEDSPPAGRVPVALYLCTADPADAELLILCVRRYIDARQWAVSVLAVDTDPSQPLAQRAGWQAVTDALSAHSVHGVVTWTSDMVHAHSTASQDSDAFDRLVAVMRERGSFLVAAAHTPLAGPVLAAPRRTADDVLRRRDLADAAAGIARFCPAAGDGSDPRAS